MRGYRNYSADPHPGELREQIDILREISVINENGYPEIRFEPVYQKVWTTADDAGNQTFRAGDSEIAQGVINFVIRYRAGIEVGMFVVFNGERREITDIGNYGFKRRYLGLKTMINRAVST